jgi:hypothetical protein
MFCKDSSKELEIVGFGCRECVCKLLRLRVFFGGFLFVSMAAGSTVHN